jgi:hypothetical protein
MSQTLSVRITGIQPDPLFRKCVEAGEHMQREHQWPLAVDRVFEYQFDRARAALCAKQADAAAHLKDASVIVFVSAAQPNQPKQQQGGTGALPLMAYKKRGRHAGA